MKNLNAILIGNGTMGKRHRSRFELYGIRFLQVLDVAEGWDENLLENASLSAADFVVIASPASTHYKFAKFFLSHHVSVFVEKPLATSAAEALELVELAKRNGVVLFVAQSECYNPIFLNFRKHFLLEVNARLNRLKKTDLGAKRCGVEKDVGVCLEFRREHGFSPRCRDVDVSLDLLIHDVSLFLMMFDYGDVEIRSYNVTKKNDAANMVVDVVRGKYSGIVASFYVDRSSEKDVRTITSKFMPRNDCDSFEYGVSLVNYTSSGEVLHIPDSLENEHRFFMKLLAGACQDWAWRAAYSAANAVEMVCKNK